MPTSATVIYNGARLDPVINADDAMASMVMVQLPASVTYAQGTILGEVTATPGVYKAYASAATDGSQNPAVILQYPATTDASGGITNTSEWNPGTASSTPAYTMGTFRTQELTGLDANAVTKLSGRLVEGTVTSGVFTF